MLISETCKIVREYLGKTWLFSNLGERFQGPPLLPPPKPHCLQKNVRATSTWKTTPLKELSVTAIGFETSEHRPSKVEGSAVGGERDHMRLFCLFFQPLTVSFSLRGRSSCDSIGRLYATNQDRPRTAQLRSHLDNRCVVDAVHPRPQIRKIDWLFFFPIRPLLICNTSYILICKISWHVENLLTNGIKSSKYLRLSPFRLLRIY